MIFFVLSGYVIAYVAFERETTLLEYAISRVSRVYSVVLPALVLTVGVDLLMMHFEPLFSRSGGEICCAIPVYQYTSFIKYFVSALLFLNYVGPLHEDAFSNGAYWSMCFEVYYYLVFALAFYLRGVLRIVLMCLAGLLIGATPFLHFPIWLLGFAVYWLHRRCIGSGLSKSTARLIFAATALLIAYDLGTDLNLRIDYWLDWITGSSLSNLPMRQRHITGDTLTGVLVAMNIFAARYASISFGRSGPLVTYMASFTFSLYLMHIPLIAIWSAYLPLSPAAVAALTLGCVWLLGQITERQKDHLRTALRRLLVPERPQTDTA
jgi:peptidoglycan/LPS O-acetylase OafA/YrhL